MLAERMESMTEAILFPETFTVFSPIRSPPCELFRVTRTEPSSRACTSSSGGTTSDNALSIVVVEDVLALGANDVGHNYSSSVWVISRSPSCMIWSRLPNVITRSLSLVSLAGLLGLRLTNRL